MNDVRTAVGSPHRLLEEHAYVAVADAEGRELSSRHYGSLWGTFTGERLLVQLLGDEPSPELRVTASAASGDAWVTYFQADGTALLRVPVGAPVGAGDVVRVDFMGQP